eukprot:29565-Pelagococcus_subviridis.AAC.20
MLQDDPQPFVSLSNFRLPLMPSRRERQQPPGGGSARLLLLDALRSLHRGDGGAVHHAQRAPFPRQRRELDLQLRVFRLKLRERVHALREVAHLAVSLLKRHLESRGAVLRALGLFHQEPFPPPRRHRVRIEFFVRRRSSRPEDAEASAADVPDAQRVPPRLLRASLPPRELHRGVDPDGFRGLQHFPRAPLRVVCRVVWRVHERAEAVVVLPQQRQRVRGAVVASLPGRAPGHPSRASRRLGARARVRSTRGSRRPSPSRRRSSPAGSGRRERDVPEPREDARHRVVVRARGEVVLRHQRFRGERGVRPTGRRRRRRRHPEPGAGDYE